jgi:hypothetical protein
MPPSAQIKTATRIGPRFAKTSFIVEGSRAAVLQTLKNRFNKVLQAEVYKYIGNLHTAFREFRSGWSMADYVAKAKSLFLTKNGKQFKHEQVYLTLQKTMPKFEIVLANIDSLVARAFVSLIATSKPTKENDVTIAAIESSEEGRTAGTPPSVVIAHDVEVGIARPTIGKKKAKVIQQTAASAAKKNNSVAPTMTAAAAAALIAEKKETNECLKRIAATAEAKNLLIMFSASPGTQQARAYFERMCSRFDVNAINPTDGVVPYVVFAAANDVAQSRNDVVVADDVVVNILDDDGDSVVIDIEDDDEDELVDIHGLPDTQPTLN